MEQYAHKFSDAQLDELINIRNDLLGGSTNRSYGFGPYYRLVSRTLRENIIDFLNGRDGIYFRTITDILGELGQDTRDSINDFYNIKDRQGISRADPVSSTQQIALCYCPKGLTDFTPEGKTLNEDLTRVVRNTLLKQNIVDESCPEDKKAITIKVFTTETNGIHIYFNKIHYNTLVRLLLTTFGLGFSNLTNSRIETPQTKALLEIVEGLCFPEYAVEKNNVKNMIELFKRLVEEKRKKEDKNIVEDFASEMQKSLNRDRYNRLTSEKTRIEVNYSSTISNLARLATELKQANRAIADYSEADYTVIKVFLNKIKTNPNTKELKKFGQTQIHFKIEEQLIFTEEKTWERILTNRDSEVYRNIKTFAYNYTPYYKTNQDTLLFCAQKLLKAILIDKTIKLFMTTQWGLDKTKNYFEIFKVQITGDGNYFPHPHLSSSFECWGDAKSQIIKAINAGDGEQAYMQMLFAFQQVTASDHVIANVFVRDLLNTRYHKCLILQKENEEKRTTIEEVIKEFIEDEKNKINTTNA